LRGSGRIAKFPGAHRAARRRSAAILASLVVLAGPASFAACGRDEPEAGPGATAAPTTTTRPAPSTRPTRAPASTSATTAAPAADLDALERELAAAKALLDDAAPEVANADPATGRAREGSAP
jgi:hypothetical protein